MVKEFKSVDEYLAEANIKTDKKIDDFVIYRYGEVNEDAAVSQTAYRNHYYEISLDINEGCSFQIDNFKFPLESKRLTFVSPKRLQTTIAHTDLPEESQGFVILFSENFINKHLNTNAIVKDYPFLKPDVSPATYLENSALMEFESIFETIRYEYQEYGAQSTGVIRSLVQVLFEKTKQQKSRHQTSSMPVSRQQQISLAFEQLCLAHFQTKSTVKEYAELLYVSPKHLTETVKQVTGRTALQTISDYKLNHAKALISQTSLSIKEIAYESGFDSSQYFSTFFRRETGMTPLAFRQI